MQVLKPGNPRDILRAELGMFFAPRGGRDSTYVSVREGVDGPATRERVLGNLKRSCGMERGSRRCMWQPTVKKGKCATITEFFSGGRFHYGERALPKDGFLCPGEARPSGRDQLLLGCIFGLDFQGRQSCCGVGFSHALRILRVDRRTGQ